MTPTAQIDSRPSPHRNPLKKPLLIAGLIVFFGFDDMLLLFLFFKIGFPHLPVLTWVVIAIVVILLNLGLALVVYRVITKRPSTGTEGLVGLTGTVEVSHGKRGAVFVRGERWDADFLGQVGAGDEVRVVSVKGLRLAVERTGPGAETKTGASGETRIDPGGESRPSPGRETRPGRENRPGPGV